MKTPATFEDGDATVTVTVTSAPGLNVAGCVVAWISASPPP
jgi:hypothetical protein